MKTSIVNRIKHNKERKEKLEEQYHAIIQYCYGPGYIVIMSGMEYEIARLQSRINMLALCLKMYTALSGMKKTLFKEEG